MTSAPAPVVNYGVHTEAKIAEVISNAQRYGETSIIALAGVPGTGKSFVGRIASQRLAGAPERVLEVQFHPSSSYETFIEGMRVESDGSITPADGAFLEWNSYAEANPNETWVVLIDEFSRADISAVLGEILTFVEDRSRAFTATYSRKPVRIAANLRVLVTYNPTDRSALEIDAALLRRLRIIDFPPDTGQLGEMLAGRLSSEALAALEGLFLEVRVDHRADFEQQMPFGHGIFSEIQAETPDLNELWFSRIRHILRRPLVQPHPFTGSIEANYPWIDPGFVQQPVQPTAAKAQVAGAAPQDAGEESSSQSQPAVSNPEAQPQSVDVPAEGAEVPAPDAEEAGDEPPESTSEQTPQS